MPPLQRSSPLFHRRKIKEPIEQKKERNQGQEHKRQKTIEVMK